MEGSRRNKKLTAAAPSLTLSNASLGGKPGATTRKRPDSAVIRPDTPGESGLGDLMALSGMDVVDNGALVKTGRPEVDLAHVFDIVDTNSSGDLDFEEIMSFYQQVTGRTCTRKQVEASVRIAATTQGRVCRKDFVSVMSEIQRRSVLVERLSWDFKLLACTSKGKDTVNKQQAKLLFEAFRGSKFTEKEFDIFNHSRGKSQAPFTLEELEAALSEPPLDSRSSLMSPPSLDYDGDGDEDIIA